MFAKVSLKSFIYDMIDVFCFPTLEVRNIYDRNGILKWHMYLNLTNTVSCLLFFIFICKLECCIKESKSRNLIFEVLKQSKMRKRLDVSHVLWEQFGMRDKSLKKQMGLYKTESTDNANICAISINPKEYFEKFKTR